MKERIIQGLYAHRKWFFLGTAFLVLGLLPFLKSIPVNGKLEGFYMKDNPYVSSFLELSDFYPYPHIFQVQFTPDSCSVEQLLNGISSLDRQLQNQFPGSKCYSLHTMKEFIVMRYPGDTLAISVLPDMAAVPVLGDMISKDGGHFLLVLRMESLEEFDLDRFNEIIFSENGEFRDPAIMSAPHMEQQIALSIGQDLVRLSLLILIFLSVVILIVYRSLGSLLVIGINVFFSMVPVIALFNLLKIELNMITLITIPVVLILTLSDSIHMINAFHRSRESSPGDKGIKGIINRFFVPSFLTSLTTAIAFISFRLNLSEYIQDFGLVVSISVLIEFAVTFMTVPFMLNFLKPKVRSYRGFGFLISKILQYKKEGGILLIMMLVVSLFFIGKLQFRTDFDTFFPLNTQLRSDHHQINENFESQIGLDLLITEKENPGDGPGLKQATVNIVRELGKIPGIDKINSFRDRIDLQMKYMNGFYQPSLSHIDELYLRDHHSRIHISISDPANSEMIRLAILEMSKQYQDRYDFSVFGIALLYDYINENVAKSLFRSLLFSGIFILIIFFMLTRSARYSLVSILANLIPMAILILLFALLRIEVNIGTAITAVICLGLIVDDTIHMLYCKLKLNKSIDELSRGLLVTSLLLAGSFILFGISNFQPTRIFGYLSAVIFLVTFISDMFILNWLIKKN